MAGRILYLVNDAGFFLSHRLPIALEAQRRGFEVAVACPSDRNSIRLPGIGIRHIDVPMPRGRGKAVAELRAMAIVHRVLRRERPNLVHLITSKPVIVGGIAARLHRVPSVAAISGLGHIFIDNSLRSRIVRRLVLFGYGAALKGRSAFPIFQNGSNLDLFARAGLCGGGATLIRGSGTDLARFDPTPSGNATPAVVLPCRMLWTKGVAEFVEAAGILRRKGMNATFVLVGDPDPSNPASIDHETLERWSGSGDVTWIGYRSDIETVLKGADIVVLPSYLEGLPKTLVDAAAAARPVVTTDVPGCRDAIVPGETGLLARPRDAVDLADKIRLLLEDARLRDRMGKAARLFAETTFDINSIVEQHLQLYWKAIASADSGCRK